MSGVFGVSFAREPVLARGLDPARLGAAPGIAGGASPEADGVFLCGGEFGARVFAR